MQTPNFIRINDVIADNILDRINFNKTLSNKLTNVNQLIEDVKNALTNCLTLYLSQTETMLQLYIKLIYDEFSKLSILNVNHYIIFKGGNLIKHWWYYRLLNSYNKINLLVNNTYDSKHNIINSISDFDFILYYKNNVQNLSVHDNEQLYKNVLIEITKMLKNIQYNFSSNSLININTQYFGSVDLYYILYKLLNINNITMLEIIETTNANNIYVIKDNIYIEKNNSEYYISFNNTLNITQNFDLFRIMYNANTSHNTKKINFKGELVDLSILHVNEKSREKHVDEINTTTCILNYNGINIRLFTSSYICYDIQLILFRNIPSTSTYPWDDKKYEKRTQRLGYMTIVSLFDNQNRMTENIKYIKFVCYMYKIFNLFILNEIPNFDLFVHYINSYITSEVIGISLTTDPYIHLTNKEIYLFLVVIIYDLIMKHDIHKKSHTYTHYITILNNFLKTLTESLIFAYIQFFPMSRDISGGKSEIINKQLVINTASWEKENNTHDTIFNNYWNNLYYIQKKKFIKMNDYELINNKNNIKIPILMPISEILDDDEMLDNLMLIIKQYIYDMLSIKYTKNISIEMELL